LLTPSILRIFFGPAFVVPTEGLSSHMTHLRPGRTKASDSMIFLQAPIVVVDGVEASEAYLTGIYRVSGWVNIKVSHCGRYP